MYYHLNGELTDAAEATVSVRDRGFMYGDAAFETLRVYGGEVFEWEAHAERLARTCEAIELTHGLADADLRERVMQTLDANDLEDAYVRLSITRGIQPGTLDPLPAVDPTVVVIAKELPRGGVAGQSVWDRPARARIVETRRVPDESIPAVAKTHNYLNGILARQELDGEDEAIMLDADGHLTEGATSNLFFVEGDTLHTPSLDGPVLPGVTRSVVFDLATEAGVPIETGAYLPDDLLSADEAFLTNTTGEVWPVKAVDANPIGSSGTVTTDLTRRFDELVEDRHYDE